MRIPASGASVALAVFVTGCSTPPVYDWRGDMQKAAAAKPTDADAQKVSAAMASPGSSMDNAVLYLQAARIGYRSQLSDQMKLEAGTSQGMLAGAGALLAAAGLKAHSDVLLVGGAALSTTYAMGSSALPRARVLAYMAGVDSLNCAEYSVAPIRTFKDNDLLDANNALRDAVRRLQVLKEFAEKMPAEADSGITEASKSAENTIAAANSMVNSTDDFLAKVRTASFLLANQVEKIDAAVTRSIINGMPDLAAVKVLSGTMGSDIAGVVGKAVNDANASKQSNGGAQSGAGNEKRDSRRPQRSAVVAMREQQDVVIDLMDRVRKTLPPDASSLNTQAMLECNLPSVPAPLVADIAAVTFFAKTPATKSIEIKGGTKEYVADTKNLPEGLTVKQPGPGGSTLQITSTDKLAAVGTFNLLIRDQTSGGSGLILQINVVAAPETKTPAKLK